MTTRPNNNQLHGIYGNYGVVIMLQSINEDFNEG